MYDNLNSQNNVQKDVLKIFHYSIKLNTDDLKIIGKKNLEHAINEAKDIQHKYKKWSELNVENMEPPVPMDKERFDRSLEKLKDIYNNAKNTSFPLLCIYRKPLDYFNQNTTSLYISQDPILSNQDDIWVRLRINVDPINGKITTDEADELNYNDARLLTHEDYRILKEGKHLNRWARIHEL